MAHDVFISYAQSDREIAGEICSELERVGISCWWDVRDIGPGVSYQTAIVDALRIARVVLLVLSEAANRSDSITRESALAERSGAVLIPVRVADFVPRDSLAYLLATRQWIDAFDARGYPRIVDAVWRALASIPPEGRAASHVSGAAPTEPAAPTTLPRAPARTGPAPRRGIFAALLDRLRPRPQAGPADFGARSAPSDPPRPEAAREEARALAEIEQAVARIEQLIVNRFEDFAELAITPRLGNALPRHLRDRLADLDVIVRQARQIQALQDPRRRLEACEESLQRVSSLQSALLDEDHPSAQALRRVLGGWTELLVAERDAAQSALDAGREIENPFILGSPVRPGQEGLFIGRRDIVREIERTVLGPAQTPMLLLYGQRRMGKTSILYQLPALLGPGFLPVSIDCQAPQTVESDRSLLRYVSVALSNALNSRLGILFDDEETRRRRGSVALAFEPSDADLYSKFTDWLDGFEMRMPQDTRLFVCLDEFERLNETILRGWGTRFLDALRHWVQHRPRFALMFVGSHTFEHLGHAWTDRFLSARRLKVTFLSSYEVRTLLTRPTPSFAMRYAAGALDSVVAATNGQPFLAQALAFQLVQHMNRSGRKLATTQDVADSIGETLVAAAEYFADLWLSRSEEERAALREIAEGRQCSGPAVRALRDYDILNDLDDFAVPLVKRWIQENALAPVIRA
jgi:hypothetical protein